MEELFDKFERKFPGFRNQIIGASAEEIIELQDLVARPLPADYLSFLQLAGNETGELFKGQGLSRLDSDTTESYPLLFDFTIDTVKKHYRKITGRLKRKENLSHQNRFNKDFLCIGTQHHSEDGGYYYLDFRQPSEPPVVNIDVYDEITVLAFSFREFLLLFGFQGRFKYLI